MLLPPEIKLNVAEFLDPQSSINFGITCKEHWKLCQPLFKSHTQAFAKAPVLTAYNALEVLRATLQDPSQGWYIREISYRDRWDDAFTTRMEDAEQLQRAARKLLSLYPDLRTTTEDECLATQIETGLATGRPDSAVAVLLHYLPNLKTLRLTMDSGGNVLEQLLERLGVEYIDAKDKSKLPLQRLRVVSLAHYDTEGCISPDSALPFLRLPSLRTFAANMMGGDFARGECETAIPFFPHPRSNIEEFFFVGCQFDVAALEYLLSCTKGLKRFTYEAGGCCTSEDAYDAKLVLRALTEHAQHSLECLVLSHFMYNEEEGIARGFYDGGRERPKEADLSALTKLTSLSANWAMLWPELSAQPTTVYTEAGCSSEGLGLSCEFLDVRDNLPPSLENLHLGGVFDREEWEGVVGPLTLLNEGTPNLSMDNIRVEGRVQNTSTRLDEGASVTIGDWNADTNKTTFGHGDKAWLKRARAPCSLFQGHGW